MDILQEENLDCNILVRAYLLLSEIAKHSINSVGFITFYSAVPCVGFVWRLHRWEVNVSHGHFLNECEMVQYFG